jgi:hypothetical protein
MSNRKYIRIPGRGKRKVPKDPTETIASGLIADMKGRTKKTIRIMKIDQIINEKPPENE